eukprot:8963881-Alexandrium_andersonii.AAC.1
MSASLVGSEMCIRDSSRHWRGPFGLLARLRPQPRPVGRRGVRPGFSPVSYTHLTLPTICSV